MAARNRPSLTAAFRGWWSDQRRTLSRQETLARLARELWEFARDSTPGRQRLRYGDIEFDWDRRVNTTSAALGWRDRLVGVFHSAYQPTEPSAFREMLEALRLEFRDYTFIDLGSGKGRTLLIASDYPFRRILGIELLPELNRIAEENIRVYRSDARQCFAIESRCADAREFVFPLEPILLYLFNPLFESALEQVMANLTRSLQDNPRDAFVLYHNPLLGHVIEQQQGWTKLAGTLQYAVYHYSLDNPQP
jgi:SAM-dependent methyltransferase